MDGQLRSTRLIPSSPITVTTPPSVLFGRTLVMRQLRDRVERVAATNVPVLIQGESGTGKDLTAQLIHRLSPMSQGAFVKVNCPAIPVSLIETELFGYEKGAFTGAYTAKRGRVEMAHKGTLFLDEVSELDASVQPKLLQLLQDGTYVRVGGEEQRSVSVRLISASNRNLRDQTEAGGFRLDLLFRINAITIEMPPLRERIEDLPELTQHFLQLYSERFGTECKSVSKHVMNLMKSYDWPGNIRQLENLVRSHVIMGDEEALAAQLVSQPTAENVLTTAVDLARPIALKEITKRATLDLERQIILKVLHANGWNRKKTARFLQISYRSLLYKLKELGVPGLRTASGELEPGDATGDPGEDMALAATSAHGD
ncbi:MAG TPA: sigma-54 dependent transcriptional regulator [Terriglobales bacterium]